MTAGEFCQEEEYVFAVFILTASTATAELFCFILLKTEAAILYHIAFLLT